MKLLAHVAAAILANASVGGSGGTIAADPEIKDQALRARILMVWEEHRLFYHAIVKSCEDSSWPEPKADALAGLDVGGLLTKFAPLITGTGPLAGIVSQLIAAIPTPKPAATPPAGPLPNPGEVKP